MSFANDDQMHTVEADGTYASEDGTQSVQLFAGDKILIQQAAQLGLAEVPKTEYADPSQMPDTAENAEAIHGKRDKGAAPENRNRGAAPDQRKAEDGK